MRLQKREAKEDEKEEEEKNIDQVPFPCVCLSDPLSVDRRCMHRRYQYLDPGNDISR